jgi:hypothetical protein
MTTRPLDLEQVRLTLPVSLVRAAHDTRMADA